MCKQCIQQLITSKTRFVLSRLQGWSCQSRGTPDRQLLTHQTEIVTTPHLGSPCVPEQSCLCTCLCPASSEGLLPMLSNPCFQSSLDLLSMPLHVWSTQNNWFTSSSHCHSSMGFPCRIWTLLLSRISAPLSVTRQIHTKDNVIEIDVIAWCLYTIVRRNLSNTRNNNFYWAVHKWWQRVCIQEF